jgi:hypothetical protein
MKKLFAATLAVGGAYVAVKQFLPDIRRYIRMRSM